jgi:hypothetical protein
MATPFAEQRKQEESEQSEEIVQTFNAGLVCAFRKTELRLVCKSRMYLV